METNLRLILLGIGVVIIALIYFWGMRKRIKAGFDERRRRKSAARAPENQPVFQGATTDQVIGGAEESAFIGGPSSTLEADTEADAVISPPAEAQEIPATIASTEMPPAQAEAVSAQAPLTEDELALAETAAVASATATGTNNAEQIPAAAQVSTDAKLVEKTVLLSVLGQGGKPLQGPAIAAASRDMALTLNDRGTLDCTTDANAGGKTIFSIAHLKEPGIFDPNTINSLATPGLLLYMQLPGPLEAVAAVDLMMATAGQLAKHLGGSVCDERRHKMTTQAMIHLRSEAADFERRLAAQQPS